MSNIMTQYSVPSRRGFTLLEMLVALVLIGLLAGALVPSVLNQLSRGEVNRVVEDVDAIGEGARMFRIDVNRWPGELDQLVTALSGTENDINAVAIPAGLKAKWDGPYLERGSVETGGTLGTSLGGTVAASFTTTAWNGTDFLTVEVTDLTENDAREISGAVDDDADAIDWATTGRVRWDSGTLKLAYLASPIQ